MSDETYDPLGLNINLKEVDTSRPVLVEGKFLFSVKECSVVPKKDDPSKRNLMVVFALDQEADSVQGDKINPGFQVRRYLPLQQSDNPNAQDFTKDLVRFLDAAFDMAGVKMDVIKSGTLKGAGIPGTSLSDAQRADLQEQVNAIHAEFRASVRSKRRMVADADMEGQVFSGRQAAGKGLVTGLGTSLAALVAELNA